MARLCSTDAKLESGALTRALTNLEGYESLYKLKRGGVLNRSARLRIGRANLLLKSLQQALCSKEEVAFGVKEK